MKVWKIITDLTPEESDMIDDLFTKEDADQIREIDATEKVYSWDYVDRDIYIPYFICNEEVIDAISDICEKYLIRFGPIDITEEFLLGLYHIPSSDFRRFREENLTEDLVYKKIKKFGGESLDALDKYILETNC